MRFDLGILCCVSEVQQDNAASRSGRGASCMWPKAWLGPTFHHHLSSSLGWVLSLHSPLINGTPANIGLPSPNLPHSSCHLGKLPFMLREEVRPSSFCPHRGLGTWYKKDQYLVQAHWHLCTGHSGVQSQSRLMAPYSILQVTWPSRDGKILVILLNSQCSSVCLIA